MGASTAEEAAAPVQSLIGNAPTRVPGEEKEDPQEMMRQLEFYAHLKVCATARKERCEELMQRRIAKTWDAKKKARMVRKLVTANQELEQSDMAIDQLTHRLSQVTTQPARANNVAPFVPAPATSLPVGVDAQP